MREFQRGAGGWRRTVAIFLAPLCFFSCSPGDAGEPQGALERLETFGFVPQGTVSIALDLRRRSTPVGIAEPLLVGMYEVTRGDFLHYRDAAKPTLDPLIQARVDAWKSSEASLPVSFVTRAEAEAYAQWAKTRLLTSGEWLFCAISPRAFAYPWGDSWQQGRANTYDLGLEPYAPTPVGTFEGGRTATHLYDMLGNVSEWVADDPDDLGDEPGGLGRPTVLGGSYLTYKREIQREGALFAESPEPGARLDTVGFRVCAPAKAWLETHASELFRGAHAEVRLQSIGRRWGRAAVPLLGELASNANGKARDALEALLSGARG